MPEDKNFKKNCPTCKKEISWNENPFRPFCSERCRLIDLGEWASGTYRIAGNEKDPEDSARDGNEFKKKADK
jgi:endogenous inhibitor of DNA gyrase (YacG/DUF329 family)